MGVTIGREKGDASSLPFLKRAIELDPNFPLAYSGIAVSYINLQEPTLALEYATKAYQLRDRVTERGEAAYFRDLFSRHRRDRPGSADLRTVDGESPPRPRSAQQPGCELRHHGQV
jgi:hypothetical protein